MDGDHEFPEARNRVLLQEPSFLITFAERSATCVLVWAALSGFSRRPLNFLSSNSSASAMKKQDRSLSGDTSAQARTQNMFLTMCSLAMTSLAIATTKPPLNWSASTIDLARLGKLLYQVSASFSTSSRLHCKEAFRPHVLSHGPSSMIRFNFSLSAARIWVWACHIYIAQGNTNYTRVMLHDQTVQPILAWQE